MSRGGRRRRGGRGRRSPDAAKRRADPKRETPRRRRSPGLQGRRRLRPRGKLELLPPDGTVLEELIADMQEEYGYPATPQEYRLIVKVAGAEGAGAARLASQEQAAAADPAASKGAGEGETYVPPVARLPQGRSTEDRIGEGPLEGVPEPGQRRRRRRRPGRARPGAARGEPGGPAAAPGEPPPPGGPDAASGPGA